MRLEAFAELVRTKREELGLNQSQLARRLGIQQQQVSKWERGTTLPDSVRLPALAAALGMDVTDLYAAHSAAAQADARSARRDRDALMERLNAFADRYEELGHTYAANHDLLLQILARLEQLEAKLPSPPTGEGPPSGRRTGRRG